MSERDYPDRSDSHDICIHGKEQTIAGEGDDSDKITVTYKADSVSAAASESAGSTGQLL